LWLSEKTCLFFYLTPYFPLSTSVERGTKGRGLIPLTLYPSPPRGEGNKGRVKAGYVGARFIEPERVA